MKNIHTLIPTTVYIRENYLHGFSHLESLDQHVLLVQGGTTGVFIDPAMPLPLSLAPEAPSESSTDCVVTCLDTIPTSLQIDGLLVACKYKSTSNFLSNA